MFHGMGWLPTQLCSVVGTNMLAFLIVAFSAVCSTQGTALTQLFENLHLHAKFGAGLPEYDSPTNQDLVDKHVSQVAEKFVKKHFPKYPMQYKEMYGPIENVVIPGVKLPRPINLSKISFNGLRRLQLNGLQWHMASNRVMCNATSPYIIIEVTFDNMEIELDEYFGYEKFNTSIHLSVRFIDLQMFASARYNVKAMLTEQDFFIDKAEVDITAKEALIELKILQSLEEVRYVLAQIFNNPLENILDAVLKLVVKEINKELLGEVKPQDITNYLISKVPKLSMVPKELIVINRL